MRCRAPLLLLLLPACVVVGEPPDEHQGDGNADVGIGAIEMTLVCGLKAGEAQSEQTQGYAQEDAAAEAGQR